MKKNDVFQAIRAWRAAETYQLIAKIQNPQKRNLLRGFAARSRLYASDAQAIRAANFPHDSLLVGALLKGPSGLLGDTKKGIKRISSDLYRMTRFPPLDWKNEVCYTAGYVNSMLEDALKMLREMRPLALLETLDSEKALSLIFDLSNRYGASNYLSYKLAYLRSARDLSPSLMGVVSQIENEFGHRENAAMHFSAIENLSSKISLFVVAQRRVSGLVGRVKGDFRASISLSNFIPTPLHLEDASGFLLRATESSLLDTVYSLLIIFNLRSKLGRIWDEFESRLAPELLIELVSLVKYASGAPCTSVVTERYRNQNEDSEQSLDLYRISSAFLERPLLTEYRSKFDQVIGARLLAEIIAGKFPAVQMPFQDRELLLAEDNADVGETLTAHLDSFYRTFLFLRFIENKANLLTLSKDQIKFVFENTLGLEALLTEDEMRTLYITAPKEMKGLISVLALALYRKKSIDPDIDFEFRAGFISHVIEEHAGSILAFIEFLLTDSPQVANYIVGSLDEVTLEKMYGLVKNASEASKIRCEILRAVGQKLNRIEYFIEADAITTRSNVSKLQQYFDSSRMYVDSVAMKKWLDANPTTSTGEYRSLYSQIGAMETDVDDHGVEKIISNLQSQNEYLVSQIAKDAFEQFCLNTEFGIQSYLGRRIRHNTLDGVTTDTVDAVFRKDEYAIVMSNATMRRTVDAWMRSYKTVIDRLRKDQLQFKAGGSLFKATLDMTDSATNENIRKLTTFLKSTGGVELLNELVIAFCWWQIAPQLDNAARFIRTSILREANGLIDKHFNGRHGVIEAQINSELHEAVNDVFKKVADWFQVPQTGFISASAKDLCDLILIELNPQRSAHFRGNAVDTKYTGISVHRLYDCLAVLLQNAHKHSEANTSLTVEINSPDATSGGGLGLLTVRITSTVSEAKYLESKARILLAIESLEAGADMVTEGYTGIKKMKFITRAVEKSHTVTYSACDEKRQVTLGFSIHAEIASDDSMPDLP